VLQLAENNVLETNREKTTTLEQNELLKYELKELRARLKDVESAPREQSSHAEDVSSVGIIKGNANNSRQMWEHLTNLCFQPHLFFSLALSC